MTYLSKFNKLYYKIINEKSEIFDQEYNCELLNSNLYQTRTIKQCMLGEHSLDQIKQRSYYDDLKLNMNVYDCIDLMKKNIGKMIDFIVKDPKLNQLIDKNESNSDHLEIICITKQFNNNKNFHLVAIFMIASDIDYDSENKSKYYFKVKTAFIKTQQQFELFEKQGFKSKDHPDQIPVLVQGESIQYNLDHLFII